LEFGLLCLATAWVASFLSQVLPAFPPLLYALLLLVIFLPLIVWPRAAYVKRVGILHGLAGMLLTLALVKRGFAGPCLSQLYWLFVSVILFSVFAVIILEPVMLMKGYVKSYAVPTSLLIFMFMMFFSFGCGEEPGFGMALVVILFYLIVAIPQRGDWKEYLVGALLLVLGFLITTMVWRVTR
jgi:hypothetical protein